MEAPGLPPLDTGGGGARLPPRVCRHQPRGVRAGGMGIPNLPAAGDDGELHQGGKARLLPGQDGQLRVDTFRLRLLKVAGRVVRTARRVFLQLYPALFLFPPAYLNSWNFNTIFTGSNLSKA